MHPKRRVRMSAVNLGTALLAVLALAAWGPPSSSASTPKTAAATKTANTASFLACEVTDTGGINDRSFNASAYAGLKAAAAKDSNIVPKFLSSSSESDYTPNINDFLGEHCGIIVTVGYAMAQATLTAAKANPKQDFAIVDCPGGTAAGCPGFSSSEKTLPNIDNLAYETNEDAFLGGYLAAAMAKPNSIAPDGAVGEFGGADYPTVTIYMDGWVAGVRYYDQLNHKSVKVYGWYPQTKGRTADNYAGNGVFTNNFTDDGLGKTDTQSLIGEGASVIFSVAGGVGLGALAAVESADRTSAGSVEMEWVDTDGCVADPSGCSYFITSVDKGIVPSVETAVLAAAHGTFKGGFYTGTL
ncbi:MAG TPA: BMP family ABC transporter substrate-binding protein, partial [Acidimicrobiales bacterium]|nr:BMP family ABC transporter substrate-binding protein [Acidimicrobiales bacterium]